MAKGDTKIEVFLNEILAGKSQRQAYYVAYPHSKKWKNESVDINASKYFNSAKVQLRYRELLGVMNDKCIVERKEVLRWLIKGAKMAIGEEETPVYFREFNTDTRQNETVEISVKQANLNALKGIADTVAKMEGLITDKVEHSGKVDGEIVITIDGLKVED